MYYDELYHHGILGMHWGIRRYQNKDGSLTAEGIKRYRTDLKFQKKYDKYRAKQDAKEKEKAEHEELKRTNELKAKKISDLTEEELGERIHRANLEKMATDLEKQYQQNINALNDMSVGAGKKFIMTVGGRLLDNAISSIGNAAIKKVTDELFPNKSEKEELQRTLKELGLQKKSLDLKIEKAKNDLIYQKRIKDYNDMMQKLQQTVQTSQPKP